MNMPEYDLWSSVMEQAIADLSDREQRQQALDWFASRIYRPGSFLFVCDALNLDPGKVLAFTRRRQVVSFAVDASPENRVVFTPPSPKRGFDLSRLQRQEGANRENYAQLLTVWRKETLFLTQTEAAARLGISKSNYAQIERGEQQPSEPLTQKIRALIAATTPESDT